MPRAKMHIALNFSVLDNCNFSWVRVCLFVVSGFGSESNWTVDQTVAFIKNTKSSLTLVLDFLEHFLLFIMEIKHRPSHSVLYLLKKTYFIDVESRWLFSLLGNMLHLEEMRFILKNKWPTFNKIWKPIRLLLHSYYMHICFSPLKKSL